MKLVIIFGPPAVGKMTVGQELAKASGLKLLYNHMSLELVNQFFPFGTVPFDRLDRKIRFAIFEEIAKSDLPGLIFTIMWAFDLPEDEVYIRDIQAVFKGAEFYFVELKTNLEERLIRNKSDHRLTHKASKRNLDWSEESLMHFEEIYRMYANDSEKKKWNILSIDNTYKSPKEVASEISIHFNL